MMSSCNSGNNQSWFVRGLHDGMPICFGYFAVSIAIGVAAAGVGMSALQSFFMSAGMMASAGQFAAISLIGAASGVLEMIFTSLVVNMRYALMSSSLSQKMEPHAPFRKKMFVAFYMTDEIFGLESRVPGYLDVGYTAGIGLVASIGWCAGTVLGVVVGNVLPADVTAALSVALYGMFLAIIIPPAKEDRFVGVLVAASMALSGLFSIAPLLRDISGGYRVIILTLLIAGAAAYIRPVDRGGEANPTGAAAREGAKAAIDATTMGTAGAAEANPTGAAAREGAKADIDATTMGTAGTAGANPIGAAAREGAKADKEVRR